MKWLFATLVALNLIVFAGMFASKITHAPRTSQIAAQNLPAQAPTQVIINTSSGTPTVTTQNGQTSTLTNGTPAGSTIGKITGKIAHAVVTKPRTTGLTDNASHSDLITRDNGTAHARYRNCSARVNIPEDDYHRIKGLLGRFPHAATRQVIQGDGEDDSHTSSRMNVLFMSVSNQEASEIQSIVGRYGSLNRAPCDR